MIGKAERLTNWESPCSPRTWALTLESATCTEVISGTITKSICMCGIEIGETHTKSICYLTTQPYAIQQRSTTEYLVFGKATEILSKVCQDIDRISDKQQNGVFAYWVHSTEDTLQDLVISVNQSQSRFAGVLFGTSCDDDDIGLPGFRSGALLHLDVRQIGCIGEIKNLTTTTSFVDINKIQSAYNATKEQ